MNIQIQKAKILGVLIPAIAVGVFFGVPLIPMTASAAGEVPDWFKGVAGFWAEEKITTAEFLDGLEFLIDQEIIQVPGFVQAADAEGVDQATISDLWTAINNMQSQINDIQTNGGGEQGPPGPEGPAGPAGAKGDQGSPGNDGQDSATSTYSKYKFAAGLDPNGETVSLNCDPGDIATGGGAAALGGSTLLRGSPYPMNSNPNEREDVTGWEARVKGTGSVDLWVVCIDIP